MLITKSCLTLYNFMDCSPSGSSFHGILQARVLGWVAMPFSKGSSQPRDRTQVSHTAGRFSISSHWELFLATVLMLILSCRTCSGSKRNLISAFSLAWVLEENPASTSAPSWVGHVLNGVSFNPWKPVTLSLLRPNICEQALNRFNSLLSACSLLYSSFIESGKFLFYCAHT